MMLLVPAAASKDLTNPPLGENDLTPLLYTLHANLKQCECCLNCWTVYNYVDLQMIKAVKITS